MKNTKLETKALKLIKQGMTNAEVEKKLGHEFMFNKDAYTDEYVSATLWKTP